MLQHDFDSLTFRRTGHLLAYVSLGCNFNSFLRPLSLQLAVFLGSMGVMEGRDGAHIRGKYKDLYRPALIANWKVWPAAQVRFHLGLLSSLLDSGYACSL